MDIRNVRMQGGNTQVPSILKIVGKEILVCTRVFRKQIVMFEIVNNNSVLYRRKQSIKSRVIRGEECDTESQLKLDSDDRSLI